MKYIIGKIIKELQRKILYILLKSLQTHRGFRHPSVFFFMNAFKPGEKKKKKRNYAISSTAAGLLTLVSAQTLPAGVGAPRRPALC